MAPNDQRATVLDRSKTQGMNITVLKRMDPDVGEIMCTASHVALYEFDISTHSWGRKNVEGTLFLVKRSTQPRFKFIVMNGKGTDNFAEEVDGETTVEQMENFILYTRKPKGLMGMWFYEVGDREEFGSYLEKIRAAWPKASPSVDIPKVGNAPGPSPGQREFGDDAFWDRKADGGGAPDTVKDRQGSTPPGEENRLLKLFMNAGRPQEMSASPASSLQDAFGSARARQVPGAVDPPQGMSEPPGTALASLAASTTARPGPKQPLPPSFFSSGRQGGEFFENGAREGAPSPGQIPLPSSLGLLGVGEVRVSQDTPVVSAPFCPSPPLPSHPSATVGQRIEGNGVREAAPPAGAGLERFFSGISIRESTGSTDQTRERFRSAIQNVLLSNDFIDMMMSELKKEGLLHEGLGS